tara:strand:+ start:171 stop:620 length:450 start_codon:yes stop_codon:yes gene_type:complete
MNPLLKGAEQIRYYSPIYEPIYDEEDNVIEEECVRNGTNILETFIKPVHNDGKPRYYRLRYPVHAKEHKRRWVQWVDNQLGNVEAFNVKVTKIGRRVLFSSDPNFQAKREKRLRRIQAARSSAGAREHPWNITTADELNEWMNERDRHE